MNLVTLGQSDYKEIWPDQQKRRQPCWLIMILCLPDVSRLLVHHICLMRAGSQFHISPPADPGSKCTCVITCVAGSQEGDRGSVVAWQCGGVCGSVAEEGDGGRLDENRDQADLTIELSAPSSTGIQ